jgi:hypothetical protein
MIALMTILGQLAFAAPLPPPDRARGDSTRSRDKSAFGADVSAGYAIGGLSSTWVKRPMMGMFLGRYEAFAKNREMIGPRIGASIWASTIVGPYPRASEDQLDGSLQEVKVHMLHYGALVAIRHAPEAPVGATAGFGFGRVDLDDYYEGPLTLPALTFEAGARFRAPKHSFIDGMARVHWATSRNMMGDALEEWWMIQFALLVGFHAN